MYSVSVGVQFHLTPAHPTCMVVSHLEFTAEVAAKDVSQAPPANVEEMISFFGQSGNRRDKRYILQVRKGIFE